MDRIDKRTGLKGAVFASIVIPLLRIQQNFYFVESESHKEIGFPRALPVRLRQRIADTIFLAESELTHIIATKSMIKDLSIWLLIIVHNHLVY